jgi:hypothetical protein
MKEPCWLTGTALPSRGDDRLWVDRRWMTTPGPVYPSDEIDWWMGPWAAPAYVAIDAEGCDVVFRQPTSEEDLAAVIAAARTDPCDAYGFDGASRWTLAGIRGWWACRHEIHAHIETMRQPDWRPRPHISLPQDPLIRVLADSWERYLDTEAEDWLRHFGFFVDVGRWPQPGERLPDLGGGSRSWVMVEFPDRVVHVPRSPSRRWRRWTLVSVAVTAAVALWLGRELGGSLVPVLLFSAILVALRLVGARRFEIDPE